MNGASASNFIQLNLLAVASMFAAHGPLMTRVQALGFTVGFRR